MDHYNFEDVSDDDSEDALLTEIQAISGACLPSPSKNNFDSGCTTVESPKTTASTSAVLGSDADFELLRRNRQQYGSEVGSGSDAADEGLFSSRPLVTWPPVESDAENSEDFDTLRAIQQQFGQYFGRQEHDFEGNPNNDILNLIKNRILNGGASGGGSDGIDSNLEESTDHTPGLRTSGNDGVCKLNVDMPDWVLAFYDAIKKNRSLQKHLRVKMMNVETRLEEISKLRKRIRTIVEYHIRCRKMIGKMLSRGQDDRMLLISSPETASTSSIGPPENFRVANYRLAFQVFPQSFPMEKWSKKERENLKKGIIQQFQNRLLQKSLDLLNVPEGPENVEVDQVMSLIGNVEMTSGIIRAFLPQVDWDLLASTYVPQRSGCECQARWLNHDDPLTNWGNWTHLEDKNLLYIIQQKGMHNWIDKAVFLGSNRTPFQCLTRYQRSLNACLIKKEWMPDEDASLISAVEEFGESNWEVTASCMEGRTGSQCSNRWLKTLLPSKQKKGRWSLDEDKQLTIAVKLLGQNNKNWCKIAEFVPGRTQARCRDRWMNCLDSNLKFGEWREEDDLKLKEAVRVHGFRWSKVASFVPSRTDNHCRRRWEVLFPEEISRVRQEKEVMRKVLPGNFVDRGPNRPTLEANDFEPLPLVESKKAKADLRTYSRKRKRGSNGDRLLFKKSDTYIFNIPKKPRSQRQRKIYRIHESWSSGSGHMSQMVMAEHDILVPGSWDRVEAFAAEQNHSTSQRLLLSPSAEQILPSLKREEKKSVRRNKMVRVSCGIQNKQTKLHAPVSSCRERVRENEVNESPSSDITLLNLKEKASRARQRSKGKVGARHVEPRKHQVLAQFSSGPSCNRAVEESTREDLLIRCEVSGTSSVCNVDGKNHKEDRFSTSESEDLVLLTLTELRNVILRKQRSNV